MNRKKYQNENDVWKDFEKWHTMKPEEREARRLKLQGRLMSNYARDLARDLENK